VFDIQILGQVALSYSSFIDAKRNVAATRLTVMPLKADAQPDAAQLLHAVGGVWPAKGGRVSLNVLSESLLRDLLQAKPLPNVMLEVPAFMVEVPANAEAIRALHAKGNTLLVKGRPVHELPRELLPCFRYSIVDLAHDRRLSEASGVSPAQPIRHIQVVQSGVRTVKDMESCFARGVAAVLGWPIDDPVVPAAPGGKAGLAADVQAIVELMQKIEAEEPIEKIEAVLKRDPTLAFRLMRYINSPAFGLRVEISSFAHAVMMLGYKRLKRWLALLLAGAGQDANQRPLMFCSLRRGLLMEELIAGSGDEELRSEAFICGVFSLLDRMFGQPMDTLLTTIPVADRVRQALAQQSGPLKPLLDIVRAVESESLFDIRAAADAQFLSMSEVNRAQLRALAAAGEIG
jgi:EAL and modified HD-GYP domain-containing signal transduction protein